MRGPSCCMMAEQAGALICRLAWEWGDGLPLQHSRLLRRRWVPGLCLTGGPHPEKRNRTSTPGSPAPEQVRLRHGAGSSATGRTEYREQGPPPAQASVGGEVSYSCTHQGGVPAEAWARSLGFPVVQEPLVRPQALRTQAGALGFPATPAPRWLHSWEPRLLDLLCNLPPYSSLSVG